MLDTLPETPTGEIARIGPQDVEWTHDCYGYWNLRFPVPPGFQCNGRDMTGRMVHAFLGPRPSYCDRGHWEFNVDGPLGHDHADSFPRYYMDLQRAKDEIVAYLNWRLYKIP